MAKLRQGKTRSQKGGVVDSVNKKQAEGSSKSKKQSQSDFANKPSAKDTLTIPSSRFGLWRFNSKTGTLRWSPNSHRLFSTRKVSEVPRRIDDLLLTIHQDDRKKFREALSFSLNSKSDTLVEIRVMTPDGSYRWIEFSGEVDPVKETIINGIIQDTTLKKLTEFELYDWKTRNELVSESAGLLIYDYDIATGEIIWSGNTVQLVGFTSMEMGSIELWEELIHPDDRAEAARLLEKSRKELKPYDVYYRFKRKFDDYCFIHDRGQFVTDDSGEAVRMLGVMNDVSERVVSDRTIKQSEKSYRELFNSVGEGIYIQKADGSFVDVNKAACAIFGYTKEELLGKNPGFIAAPGKNNFDDLIKKMSNALKGKVQTFQWFGRRKNGEVFIMDVKLTRGTYFGDECIIATSWDITEKIAAEQTLQESEKRFRRLVEDLNVGVMIQGPKGEIQMANKAALNLLGVSEEYLADRTLNHSEWNLITEERELLAECDLPWNLAAESRKGIRGVVIGLQRPKDNAVVWALVNAEPILLEGEKLLRIVITLTDITERRQVIENLKESELRFRTLQEASFGGIGLHNKGQIIDCNQGLCDITGYSHDELIGSNGLNLIAPEYRDLVYQKIVTKDELPYDVQGIRKDGTRYNLEIQGKNIPYDNGLIRVTEFRDITERKAAESKILEQNARLMSITEDLKMKNEQLQEFTQIVSHNLRSPVGNILSLLNFIENAETEEERREYVTLLREAGASTLTTLQELNEVLQIKQNKHIEKQKLEFEQVFVNVRRMLVAKIVESNAEIITDFSALPTLEYPNIYMESILLNLISNALKYHHPDRRPVIEIRTGISQRGATLSIKDNGQGINMERYGHQIFKLRKTFHKHPESRGIGLFMIKNQINAMGGDITVLSKENEGSTFLINFNSRITEDEFTGSHSSISG
jgi:PAS domain S-box-containing protein